MYVGEKIRPWYITPQKWRNIEKLTQRRYLAPETMYTDLMYHNPDILENILLTGLFSHNPVCPTRVLTP